jgi:hypothetical protein
VLWKEVDGAGMPNRGIPIIPHVFKQEYKKCINQNNKVSIICSNTSPSRFTSMTISWAAAFFTIISFDLALK